MCFDQGLSKQEQPLPIHQLEFCLQKWTGAVSSSSVPEIQLSRDAPPGPAAEGNPRAPILQPRLAVATVLKASSHFFLISFLLFIKSCWLYSSKGLALILFQLPKFSGFWGEQACCSELLHTAGHYHYWVSLSFLCWFHNRKESWKGCQGGKTSPPSFPKTETAPPKHLLPLVQSVLINLYKGNCCKLPSQPMPAVSLAVIK